MTSFNLSDKIEESATFGSGKYQYMIYTEDVREFIRLLKDYVRIYVGEENHYIINKIDELAGEKLI